MYSMLMLATLLTLRQGALLLRSTAPPIERRPWVGLGMLLGVLMWINYGGLAVWLGLGMVCAWRTLSDWRHQGWDPFARLRLRGLAIAYLTGALVGGRSLWMFWIMSRHKTAQTSMTAATAAESLVTAAASLDGLGWLSVGIFLLAAAGLIALCRRDASLACLVAAVGAATLGLVFAGRFVHGVFAPRYLTLIQPALWLGLAYLPWGLRRGAWRQLAFAMLLLVAGIECREVVRLLQPGYAPEWDFFARQRLGCRSIASRRTRSSCARS